MRWSRAVSPRARISCAVLTCLVALGPSSADAEELRTCLSALVASPRSAGRIVATLERLLAANRRAFELARDGTQSPQLFGADGRDAADDYELYGRAIDAMREEAVATGRSEYTRAVIALVVNLRPVVRENVEWSQNLATAVGDLAREAPESYVRHLSTLPPLLRRAVIDELWVICERDGADDLRRGIQNSISLRHHRSTREAGDQVREYLRRGCRLSPAGTRGLGRDLAVDVGQAASLDLGAAALGAASARSDAKDVNLAIVNVQTVVLLPSGEYRMSPYIVVKVTDEKARIQSFGLSGEIGILLLPLPPGRYCYDAFSRSGRALKMVRPRAERCFMATQEPETTIGVGYYE